MFKTLDHIWFFIAFILEFAKDFLVRLKRISDNFLDGIEAISEQFSVEVTKGCKPEKQQGKKKKAA